MNHHLSRLEMRMVNGFLHIQHRTAWDTGFIKQIFDLFLSFGSGPLAYDLLQTIFIVFASKIICLITRIIEKVFPSDGFAESFEQTVVADTDRNISVFGFIDIKRSDRRVDISLTLRDHTIHSRCNNTVFQKTEDRVCHSNIYLLSLSSAFSVKQCHQDTYTQIDSSHIVSDRRPYFGRRRVRKSRHVYHSSHRLGNNIVTRTVGQRSVLSEAGTRSINDARIDLL